MVFDPITLGIFTAASGAMSAFGKHNAAVADTNYANAVSQQQYANSVQQWQYGIAQQQNQWRQQLAIDQQTRKQYGAQIKENQRAYGEYLFQNQAKFNEVVEQAMGDKLNAQLQLMQANAANDARGRTGKRSGMANQANIMRHGMEQSKRLSDLANAEYWSDYEAEQMQHRVNFDNMNAYYQSGVGIQRQAPVFAPGPSAPVMRSGPSQMGLYTGLLGAGLSGYKAWSGLQPSGA